MSATRYRVDYNRYDGEYRVYQDGNDPRPVTNSMFMGKNAKADCERIVQAVNSHDALREALEEAYHELRVRCGYKDGDHCYETLKAALGLAKKGA